MFFKMDDHPFLKECGDFQSNTDKPIQFELMEGKDGYWEEEKGVIGQTCLNFWDLSDLK